MRSGFYELVVVWASGGNQVYTGYESREKAEKAGHGMQMALGDQIQYWCVRDQF